MTTPPKIIIFGPTGGVGSNAALTARQLGAEVVLAMRDTSKAIPGLSAEQESAGGFSRVQADLTQPASVRAAAESTGATRAFVYLVHASPDHMRATVEALKAGGVDLVVFLSTATVRGADLAAIPASPPIAHAHARVEMTLAEVMGPSGYIALRAGYFATNAHQWVAEVRSGGGKLPLPFADADWDWIASEDMGRVAGTLAVGGIAALEGHAGDEGSKNAVLLLGPQVLSQRRAAELIAGAAGKGAGLEVVDVQDVDEGLRVLDARFGGALPGVFVRTLVMIQKDRVDRVGLDFYADGRLEAGVDNIRKFGGGKITTFEEWVEAHKHEFA